MWARVQDVAFVGEKLGRQEEDTEQFGSLNSGPVGCHILTTEEVLPSHHNCISQMWEKSKTLVLYSLRRL